MANALYPSFLDKMWNGLINIGSDTFKAALVTSGYTFDASHVYYSSLTNVLGSAAITTVTSTNGVLDGDDTLVTGLTSGDPHAVIVYKWTGTTTTSPLFLYLTDGLGFDTTPTGDIHIIWSDDVTSKIFPLGGRAS